jgi:hypothetical protein
MPATAGAGIAAAVAEIRCGRAGCRFGSVRPALIAPAFVHCPLSENLTLYKTVKSSEKFTIVPDRTRRRLRMLLIRRIFVKCAIIFNHNLRGHKSVRGHLLSVGEIDTFLLSSQPETSSN